MDDVQPSNTAKLPLATWAETTWRIDSRPRGWQLGAWSRRGSNTKATRFKPFSWVNRFRPFPTLHAIHSHLPFLRGSLSVPALRMFVYPDDAGFFTTFFLVDVPPAASAAEGFFVNVKVPGARFSLL